MTSEPRQYKVLLYQRPEQADEFDWREMELYGFLGTRLGSQGQAAEAIAEADQHGTATRTIEYAMGNIARVVISPLSPVRDE